MTEEQIERDQIEWVFGLTGGELEDEPWTFVDAGDVARRFLYWYEDVPHYDTERSRDIENTYRTAVVCELWGNTSTPPGWVREASYLSSGETECPCDGANPACALCGGDGIIYLGDGYCEVVYRLDTEPARRRGFDMGKTSAEYNPDADEAFGGVEYAKQYSPFDVFAASLNAHECASELWDAFDAGVTDGIASRYPEAFYK